MENSFLPIGYKAPEGNYAKLKPGENTFRILGSAIVGYEYWNNDNKPVRSATQFAAMPADIRTEDDGKFSIKHFWMFPVWNYDNQKIQVMEITQKGIQDSLRSLVANPKWGNPIDYDITITKQGSGFDTSYQTMPNPKAPLSDEIMGTFLATKINLEAVYTGGDPFLG